MSGFQALPYLEDLESGDELPPLTYEVTQRQIDEYGTASLDLNPVHMDPDWCERARVFGTPKPVQHGMMSMSFMTSTVLRGLGPFAEIVSVESKFTKPVPVGGTVSCRAVLRDLHVLANGNDFAVFDVTAVDQDGDTVGLSEIRVRLPRRPADRP